MPLEPDSNSSRGRAEVQVAGNSLAIFDQSAPLLAAMLEDIAQARQRVWMETYIFADDEAGRAIAAALTERARAGVEVRLMVDAFGSFGIGWKMFDALVAAGGKLHAFHSLIDVLWRRPSLRLLNRRNHRKLLVIDDRVAFFGGMNIVDASGIEAGRRPTSAALPSSAAWRDVHVRLSGPDQLRIAACHDRLWRDMHDMPQISLPHWPIDEMLRGDDDGLFFFDSRPYLRYRRMARVLAPLIRRTRHDLTLAMAYFVPVGRVLREMLRARRRGVRVRVVLPAKSDVRLARWAARHFYMRLLRRGVRIYERQDQMLHSKAMVIDGRVSVVGSCNLDPRSLRTNLEFVAVIRSRGFATELVRICHEEIERSQRISAADCRARNCIQRLIDRLAWSLRRWL